MNKVSAFSVQVETGTCDKDAVLLLVDSRLLACLVRLDDPCHGALQHQWCIECAFGFATQGLPDAFSDVPAAIAAVTQRTHGSALILDDQIVPLVA